MISVDLMSLWNAVCSVHLCFSVRNRTHPLDKISLMQVAGEFFLSRRVFFSLTEHTEFTESLGTRFDPTRGGDSNYLVLAKRRVNGWVVGSCE